MLKNRQFVRAFLCNVSFFGDLRLAKPQKSEIRGAKTLSAHEQPRRAAGWGFLLRATHSQLQADGGLGG